MWYIRCVNVRASHNIAGWSSRVAHMVHTHEVASSSLVPATKLIEGVGNAPADQCSG